MSQMKVIKSNSKKTSLKRSDLKKNVHGNLEGKTLQKPLNDQPEYKKADSNDVSIPAPADGSVPTWRCKNGAILPMIKFENEDGEEMYKPRAKKGPAKGKKYSPRKGKTAKVAELVKKTLTQAETETIEINPTEAAWAKLSKFQEEKKASEEAEPSFQKIPKDGVDFLSLAESWKMKQGGKLNDLEFAIVKNTIMFRQRQAAEKMAAEKSN